MSTTTTKPQTQQNQTQKESTDIILNKANVALARSQRLVTSWLPPPTAEDHTDTHVKSEEELQREEDEIFTAVPERLGIGAPLPSKAADGSWNRTELSSNDALRRQLLGKNYKRVMAAKQNGTSNAAAGNNINGSGSGSGNRLNGSKHGRDGQKPEGESGDGDEEEEEEDGRTAAVGNRALARGRGRGKKRELDGPTPTATATATATAGQDGSEGAAGSGDGVESTQSESTAGRTAPSGPKGRKKATSFLDEILADRSKKRKKR